MEPPIPADRPRRRRQAALAGHHRDAAAARRHLTDDDPVVRATALGALRRADSLDDDTLAAGLTDSAPEVRRRAAELLAADEAAGRARPHSLLGLLGDDDTTVVEMAAWASGERPTPEPGLLAALSSLATTHPDSLCREAAVAALGSIGHPDGVAAILVATRDKATVRRRAVLALAPFDGPDVDEALARALTDRDRQVRQAAEDLTQDRNGPGRTGPGASA